MKERKLISIITPVFNEAENVPYFFNEILKVIKPLNYKFEIIFIDDGSTDSSVANIHGLHTAQKNVEVKLVQLARNFGKEIATTAGLHAVRGLATIIIDSDMQHPVEKIPEFLQKWEAGADVVIGVRKIHAHDNKIKKVGSVLFYKIMSRISDTIIVPHSTDYRLIDRQIVEAFSKFTEHSRMTRGLIDWLGFERDVVEFTASKRKFGEASYGFRKLLTLAINGFTTHSLFPLKLAGYLGTALFVSFGILGIVTYVESYLLNDPLGWAVSGTAMLAILMLFSIGIVLACQGLVAIYIANIHNEVMNRPLYVVKKSRKQ